MFEKYKCNSCGAQININETDLIIQCEFCGAKREVPNYEQRKRLLLDQEHQKKRFQQEFTQREEQQQERKQDKKRDRRFWAMHRVWIFVAVLIAPSIILFQTMHVYSRYFGTTGKERLQLTLAQQKELGCTTLQESTTVYVDEPLVNMIKSPANGSCLQVVVAGGEGHSALTVKLFDPKGTLQKKSDSGTGPQAFVCTPEPGLYRYEIDPGINHHGRLSYALLSCPESAFPKDATTPKGKFVPIKGKAR